MNASSGVAIPSAGRSGPLVALALLALIWGYNWVVMKVAMQYVGPMEFAALRGTFGAVLLFGVLLVLGVPLRPQYTVKTIFLGLFQTAGFVGLISWAISNGAAGK